MYLAIKEMKKNKSRFTLIIAIIILISYLVFFLSALADGLSNDKVSAINLWNSKKVVLNKDANGSIMRSQIPYEKINEYKNAAPLTIMRESAFINDEKKEDDLLDIVLMGVEKYSFISPEIKEGRSPRKLGEAIVSEDMKKENGVKTGDKIHLSDSNETITVTGITDCSKYGNTPVIYVYPEEMYNIFSAANNVKGEYSRENSMVNAFILQNSKTNSDNKNLQIMTTDAFIKDLPGYKAEQMTFAMMIGFLIVISAIILGVFLYIITLQKKNIFAIMKIQGITGGYIAKSVMAETIIMAVIGVLSGLLLTLLTGAFLPAAVPFRANPLYFAGIALFMIGTSLLGSVFSMKGVLKIDPLKALN